MKTTRLSESAKGRDSGGKDAEGFVKCSKMLPTRGNVVTEPLETMGFPWRYPSLFYAPYLSLLIHQNFGGTFFSFFFLKRVGEGSAPDLATAAFKKRLERDWSVRASRDVIVHVERFALEACGNGVRGRHAKLKGLQALGGLGESTSR